ncbi:MAG: hypothetical protein H7144_14755, partial [Burkholderiales bacterium]|nr:hypothetical protein [Phycisphaerae bacterium]
MRRLPILATRFSGYDECARKDAPDRVIRGVDDLHISKVLKVVPGTIPAELLQTAAETAGLGAFGALLFADGLFLGPHRTLEGESDLPLVDIDA